MNDSNSTNDNSDIWIIDDRTKGIFFVVFCCIVSAAVAFLGIIFNVLNIAAFVKMGFQETTNMTLLALSVSDLCGLLTLEWMFLCFNPPFLEARLPLVLFEVQYITGGYPHMCFSRITGFLTAYVTFERCLCITRPLVVKRVLTPSRTLFIIVGIYLFMIASVARAFEVNPLQWKFFAPDNTTKLGIVYSNARDEVEAILLVTNNSFGYIAFGIVSLCTAILVSRLKANQKWRIKSISGDHAKLVTFRDKRMVRIVLTISMMFITLSFPFTIVFLMTTAYPQFGSWGKYSNLFYTCAACVTFLEIMNSSFTFFIYYSMSSKFRQTANLLWTIRGEIRDSKFQELRAGYKG
ncbi:tachykinin-like peptides receptor 86C [Biomphalaria pfeifferi]|uniref:Tachykinin-like peptides receptor 86C n=1 Tax=Biomphalaria pfeifferi TaxID=112525 RepID=A0AAD8B631_BIOPF|nr:tachykinin-like peptides receptor 86C [Biomphalaria pfeifferi]